MGITCTVNEVGNHCLRQHKDSKMCGRGLLRRDKYFEHVYSVSELHTRVNW